MSRSKESKALTYDTSKKNLNEEKCIGCERLKQEIARLKQELENVRQKGRNDSLIEVTFRNKDLSRKYKSSVDKFLRELLSQEKKYKIDSVYLEEQDKGDCYVVYQDFCIDSIRVHKDGAKQSWKTPFYNQDYSGALQSVQKKEIVFNKEMLESPKQQVVTCFNCLGPHLLDKCPEKLDRQKIAQNRKEFLMSSQSTPRTSRYHEDDQCRNVKPGIISEELRQALALYPDQLPLHIYRMRILGYPPGWLKEAEVEHSGINLYDEEGKAVLDDGHKDKYYDPKKLIDYPGFNAPLPSSFIDEWKELKMVPMKKNQLRSEVEKTMKTPEYKPYRKRKETDTPQKNNKERKIELPDSDKQRCSCTTPKQSQKSNDNASPMTISYRNENGNIFTHNISGKECLFSAPSDSSQDSIASPYQESTATKCPVHSCSSSSLFSCPGTPVVSTGNRFTKLPDPLKFAKDITEHIPYENLPDATGSFEKMRNVLEIIKQKQELLHNSKR